MPAGHGGQPLSYWARNALCCAPARAEIHRISTRHIHSSIAVARHTLPSDLLAATEHRTFDAAWSALSAGKRAELFVAAARHWQNKFNGRATKLDARKLPRALLHDAMGALGARGVLSTAGGKFSLRRDDLAAGVATSTGAELQAQAPSLFALDGSPVSHAALAELERAVAAATLLAAAGALHGAAKTAAAATLLRIRAPGSPVQPDALRRGHIAEYAPVPASEALQRAALHAPDAAPDHSVSQACKGVLSLMHALGKAGDCPRAVTAHAAHITNALAAVVSQPALARAAHALHGMGSPDEHVVAAAAGAGVAAAEAAHAAAMALPDDGAPQAAAKAATAELHPGTAWTLLQVVLARKLPGADAVISALAAGQARSLEDVARDAEQASSHWERTFRATAYGQCVLHSLDPAGAWQLGQLTAAAVSREVSCWDLIGPYGVAASYLAGREAAVEHNLAPVALAYLRACELWKLGGVAMPRELMPLAKRGRPSLWPLLLHDAAAVAAGHRPGGLPAGEAGVLLRTLLSAGSLASVPRDAVAALLGALMEEVRANAMSAGSTPHARALTLGQELGALSSAFARLPAVAPSAGDITAAAAVARTYLQASEGWDVLSTAATLQGIEVEPMSAQSAPWDALSEAAQALCAVLCSPGGPGLGRPAQAIDTAHGLMKALRIAAVDREVPAAHASMRTLTGALSAALTPEHAGQPQLAGLSHAQLNQVLSVVLLGAQAGAHTAGTPALLWEQLQQELQDRAAAAPLLQASITARIVCRQGALPALDAARTQPGEAGRSAVLAALAQPTSAASGVCELAWHMVKRVLAQAEHVAEPSPSLANLSSLQRAWMNGLWCAQRLSVATSRAMGSVGLTTAEQAEVERELQATEHAVMSAACSLIDAALRCHSAGNGASPALHSAAEMAHAVSDYCSNVASQSTPGTPIAERVLAVAQAVTGTLDAGSSHAASGEDVSRVVWALGRVPGLPAKPVGLLLQSLGTALANAPAHSAGHAGTYSAGWTPRQAANCATGAACAVLTAACEAPADSPVPARVQGAARDVICAAARVAQHSSATSLDVQQVLLAAAAAWGTAGGPNSLVHWAAATCERASCVGLGFSSSAGKPAPRAVQAMALGWLAALANRSAALPRQAQLAPASALAGLQACAVLLQVPAPRQLADSAASDWQAAAAQCAAQMLDQCDAPCGGAQ